MTTAERDRMLDDGAGLMNGLYSDDEFLRWRRFMKVAYRYQQCAPCDLWTEREPEAPCTSCGVVPYVYVPTDFLIRTEGRISLLAPLTERARAWVDENITEHVEYSQNVVIEQPDLQDILVGIIDDGLSII